MQETPDPESDDDVVVPAQNEVKVYLNQNGDIVVKRDFEDFELFSSDQDKEVAIIIPRLHVPKLIERLKLLLAHSG